MIFERDYETDPDDILDDSFNPATSYEEQQVAKNVNEVFGLLRDVTLLHVLGELSLTEVSKTLNVKRSTVERAWKQAREVLKEHI